MVAPGRALRRQGRVRLDRELQQALERESKDEPDYAQASAAAAGEVLQLAIEKAGTLDPAKVRDALAALDTTTFFGRIKFGPTGQISSLDPPVFQLQGGKPVVIFPDYVKQADFKFGVQ